ncbi:hypothetical protein CIB48_g3292 [Xylaria polymorpha]|nr:hypothetical protein CIB48_g3292 [Xylaria polymorpha]
MRGGHATSISRKHRANITITTYLIIVREDHQLPLLLSQSSRHRLISRSSRDGLHCVNEQLADNALRSTLHLWPRVATITPTPLTSTHPALVTVERHTTTMCFFDQTRWNCGYWRWGHFREQCNKEYRTGETCGLKFVYNTISEPEDCKLCKDIEKKKRKFNKLHSDITRWQRETNRSASIEKAHRDMIEVQQAIDNMTLQHQTRAWGTV